MPGTHIRPWDGGDDELRAVADVYADAFAEPPYDENPEDSRTEIIARIRRYAAEKPRFRLLLAMADDTVAGFVLGTGIGPGDWWWGRLDAALSDEARAEWLRPQQFSVAELAIAAGRRRSGLARDLMTAVLRDLPYDTALLGCYRDAEPAKRLYASLGWTVIDAAAQITPNRRIQVMGLRLPAT
ncbi:GNAT family N-acetyltransferase [Microbacterium hydrocarbonoxydans]|uniref:GNAT family N-acetyltransferase n=1 Tax=Microbacterium hydrocarbonoxydans TaxID=273678 RepID=UPI0013DBD89D|nr:GNAT family N-acetyltransferase [Microbacterium hydrocarbonoxydans]